MNKKIVLTIILFLFSFLYLKNAIYFTRENDKLMKTIKEKEDELNQKPVDAIITENTMIPGLRGKKINLEKTYQKMKAINTFQESLIVYDEVLPEKSINNTYDKVIVSGNFRNNKISIITELDNDYCYTEDLSINKECVINNKYTILVHKITNNHLTKVKELVKNGIFFYLKFSHDNNDLDLIKKYLKNNNYEIVSIKEIITE